jgi:hypothetical protein
MLSAVSTDLGLLAIVVSQRLFFSNLVFVSAGPKYKVRQHH